MKKTLLVLCLGFLAASTMSAQKSKGAFTAKFEDGTVIDYELLQNRPDELFRRHISVLSMANDLAITNEISFSEIRPGRFQYKAGVYAGLISGFGGVTASGTWYLGSAEKPIQQSVTVRSISGGNTTTKYVVKVDATKGKYWGIHGELAFHTVNYKNLPVGYDFGGGSYSVNKVSYGVVAAGFGYNSFRGAQVNVKESMGGYIGGTRLFTAVADLAFYPGLNVDATASDSIAGLHKLEGKDISEGTIGFRMYVQSQTTFVYHKKKEPNGCLGIMWRLGALKSAYTSKKYTLGNIPVTPVFGLGLMYTFY